MNRWFDASAFVAPPANSGRFGNSGKDIIVGPGRQVMNTGMFKSFKPTERISVRLQATYQNLFNHPNFGNPNLNISTPAAVGTITSMGTPRGRRRTVGIARHLSGFLTTHIAAHYAETIGVSPVTARALATIAGASCPPNRQNGSASAKRSPRGPVPASIQNSAPAPS